MPGPSADNSIESNSARLDSARIELVLFDYGMVLSAPPDPAAWARMKSITGLDEPTLHSAYWAFRHDYDRGALTAPSYWRAVAARTGIMLNDTQLEALLAADLDLWSQPNQPMVDWAMRLQRANMRTAVLSNIGDAMAAGLSARLAWLRGFERCIWSYELSLAKPDPAIYRSTLALLRVAPASILFIDDKQENIAAAAALGMCCVQYIGPADFERTMHARGLASLLAVGRPAGIPAPTMG